MNSCRAGYLSSVTLGRVAFMRQRNRRGSRPNAKCQFQHSSAGRPRLHQLRANRRNHKHACKCASPRALSRNRRDGFRAWEPRLLQHNSLQATVRKQLSHGLQPRLPTPGAAALFRSPLRINTYPYYIQRYMLNPRYSALRIELRLEPAAGAPRRICGQGDFGLDLVRCNHLFRRHSPLTPTDSAGSDFCGGVGWKRQRVDATGNFACRGPANVLTFGEHGSTSEQWANWWPRLFQWQSTGSILRRSDGRSFRTGTGFGKCGTVHRSRARAK